MANSADLHCLQRQGISGFSKTRVKLLSKILVDDIVPFLSFFRENKTWHFMLIICEADDSHEILSFLLFFFLKNNKNLECPPLQFY